MYKLQQKERDEKIREDGVAATAVPDVVSPGLGSTSAFCQSHESMTLLYGLL